MAVPQQKNPASLLGFLVRILLLMFVVNSLILLGLSTVFFPFIWRHVCHWKYLSTGKSFTLKAASELLSCQQYIFSKRLTIAKVRLSAGSIKITLPSCVWAKFYISKIKEEEGTHCKVVSATWEMLLGSWHQQWIWAGPTGTNHSWAPEPGCVCTSHHWLFHTNSPYFVF